MLVDLASGTVTGGDADVAIIGAGAAGISMARELADAGRHVMLIESGGSDFEAEASDLNAGDVIGQEYYPLEDARLRFFGGTTAIWGGRCAELDPIDFERKEWVEYSGWPFGIDELRPWYDKARSSLGISASDRLRPDAILTDLARSGDLAIREWAFDRRFDRFGLGKSQLLVAHPRVTVLLHATVREIMVDPSGRAVTELKIVAPGGREIAVRARTYVLAAGGLENPRILLASNSVIAGGIGNGNDLVGRFFMEHPHGRGGRLHTTSLWGMLQAFQKQRVAGGEFAPLLTASARAQREHGLLNGSLTIGPRAAEDGQRSAFQRAYVHAKHRLDPTFVARSAWKLQRRLSRNLKIAVGPVTSYRNLKRGKRELTLSLRAEQAPNPASRVLLGEARDAIGMPRIKLDWRLSSQDVDSARGLVALVARQVEARDLGRVEMARWLEEANGTWVSDANISAHPLGGYHHMGTTRMADDPRRGVTDAWGRVHGMENLYVAGSSLFPTGGWANPTLTLIALSLRTAAHLAAAPR